MLSRRKKERRFNIVIVTFYVDLRCRVVDEQTRRTPPSRYHSTPRLDSKSVEYLPSSQQIIRKQQQQQQQDLTRSTDQTVR